MPALASQDRARIVFDCRTADDPAMIATPANSSVPMKLYKIVLVDRREEFVPADSFSEVEDRIVFFRGGQPIPDVFFKADSVLGVTVVSDDYERDSRPQRYWPK